MYEHFGKVREIDGTADVNEIYEKTRASVLPQVSFMIGPIGSGKSCLGKNLCSRTNMELMNYDEFIASSGLEDKDEETQTVALIKALSRKCSSRVLLESFPQTEF